MMTKELRVKNSRGLKLAAVIERPEGEGKFPFIILLHGFTGWKEERHIESLAELLAQNGIGALRFDASGSGESQGSFYDDYRLANYLDDLEGIYSYLLSQDYVDKEKIGLWAHSFGGQVMTWFSYKHPEIAALCFCQATIRVQGKAHLEKIKADWKAKGYREFETETMGTVRLPYSFFRERQEYDGQKVLADIKIPKLFIAGAKDDLVSQADVESSFAQAHEPKEYYFNEQADHMYKNHQDILQVINQRTLKFFQNHL